MDTKINSQNCVNWNSMRNAEGNWQRNVKGLGFALGRYSLKRFMSLTVCLVFHTMLSLQIANLYHHVSLSLLPVFRRNFLIRNIFFRNITRRKVCFLICLIG